MNERALHRDETTLERWTPYSPLGWLPVPLNDVAATFVRSIEGPQTGQVYELGDYAEHQPGLSATVPSA